MNNYPQREVLNPVFPNNIKPYRLGLTGHRPKKLGNVYDLNDPRWQNFMQDLNQVLEQRIQEYGYVECHSGMALGADMAWALVIQSARERYPGQVKFVADIPNPDQPAKWTSPETVALFYDLVDNADERVTYAPTYTKECLNDRNIGMIDHSDEVIALWDGTASGTGHAVAYAESLNKFIKVLHPEQYGFEVKRDPRTPVVDNTQNYNHPNGNNFGNNYGQGGDNYSRGNNGYNGNNSGGNYSRGNNGYNGNNSGGNYSRGNNGYNSNNSGGNYSRGNNGNNSGGNYSRGNNGYNGNNSGGNYSRGNNGYNGNNGGGNYSRGNNGYNSNNGGGNYSRGNNGYNGGGNYSRGNNGYNGGGNYSRGNNGYNGGGNYSRGNNGYNGNNSGGNYSRGNNGYNGGGNYSRGNNDYNGGGNNYNRDNGGGNPTNQSQPSNSFRSDNQPRKPDSPEASKQANGLMNMEPSSYIYDKRTVKDLEEVEQKADQQKAAPTKSPQTKAPSAPQTQAPSYDAMMSQVQEEQVDLGANIVKNAPEFNDHDIPDPSMDMMGM